MQKKHYQNQFEAGEILAEELLAFRGEDVLVLAVPRGGVPVALPVMQALHCELDLIIPRKIGAPLQPEVAIGAVCEDGDVLLNPYLVRALGVTDDYLNKATAKEVAEIKRRLGAYRGVRSPAAVEGRTVIVVDDGVATGFTITAALQAVARRRPSELVLAVPVAPPDTVDTLASEVDRIICPLQPESFSAVGQFYKRFEQLHDGDVQRMLAQAWHGFKKGNGDER
ncbi:MAG: phosphoribosyltransferase [Bacillota bacterium]|nr:phosphoribosyltransferase [Bacillota bacterium]